MHNKDIDDKIKEAELRKLIAEEEKIKAEKQKIDWEKAELGKPFYRKPFFIQAVIAGVLGGLAILSVFQTIIEPTYKKDIILQELEVAEKKKTVAHLNDSLVVIKDSIKRLVVQGKYTLDSIAAVKRTNGVLLNNINKGNALLKEKEQDIIAQKRKAIDIVDGQLKDMQKNAGLGGLLISTVYFEYDRTILVNTFKENLDKVVLFLNTFPQLKIQINGYAGEVGSSIYNQKLSEVRARAVSDYLIKKGVSPERIITKGYGEIRAVIGSDAQSLDRELRMKLYELQSVVKIIVLS